MDAESLSRDARNRLRGRIFKSASITCRKCDHTYDVAGHPAGVILRCLQCGEELEETQGEFLLGAEESRAERLGKYLIVREVARGGMGIVFEAEDTELRRRVAIKVLKDGEDDPETVKRLHREAAIAAQLSHPNIVTIHEVGMVRDRFGGPTHFIVMDFVEGITLADLLRRRETKLPNLLRMFEEVARAVAFAHSRGVIHRDIKPSNVLIEGGAGRVVLSDFGLARSQGFQSKLTRSVAVLGTPQYMAPEQVEGRAKDIDARTDVYALGVILYEVLAGRPPFEADTPAKLYDRILKDEPTRPSLVGRGIGDDLEVVCLKAIEKDPAQRYPSAQELADEIRRYREGEPIRARPVSHWRRWGRRARRHRVAVASIGLLAAFVLAAGGWGFQIRRSSVREQARREAALKRLSALSSKIAERNRDLRTLRTDVQTARGGLLEAIRDLDGYVREWSGEPEGYYVRARGKMYLGDLDGAESDLQAALAKKPEFRPGWSLLGMVRTHRYQIVALSLWREGEERWRRLESLLKSALEAFARGWHAGREQDESERWGIPWSQEDGVLETYARAIRTAYFDGNKSAAQTMLESEIREYRAEEFANLLGLLAEDAEESERWHSRALEWAPGYGKAYFDRGNARVRKQDFTGARGDYDQAIAWKDDFAIAYVNRGAVKGQLQDYSAAIADYDRAIELQGSEPQLVLDRGYMKSLRGDPAGAVTDYDRAIEMDESNAEAYRLRAQAKEKLGDPRGAIADYGRLLDRREDNVPALFQRGFLRNETGDRAGAIEDFDRVIGLRKDFQAAYVNRGDAKMALGDLRGAIEDFDEATRLKPDDANAFVNRGNAKQEMKDYAGAVLEYDRAIVLRPKFALAFRARGLARMRLKNYAEAIADYDQAIGLEPTYDAFLNRGLTKELQRNFAEAIADYTRAIELRQDDPKPHFLRGRARSAHGDFANAVTDFERALHLASPEWPQREEASRLLKFAKSKLSQNP